MPKLLFLPILFLVLFVLQKQLNAQSLDQQIQDIGKQIDALEKATAPLKSETSGLSQKISSAQGQIIALEKTIKSTDENLAKTDKILSEQEILYKERISRYYKNTTTYSPISILLTNTGNDSLRYYSLFQNILRRDQQNIISYVTQMDSLVKAKSQLAQNQTKLQALKKSMESRFGFLQAEIKKAETYKKELSEKQKSLVAQKESLLSTSVGNVSTSDDPASRADYNPGFSPAYAAFSFGAPHRKGMSQYGAYARAKSGQGYEEILKTYYGNIKIEKISSPDNIKTTVGQLPFEDNYLIGIAEMPASWGDNGGAEALKAQAIAARTYALTYLNWRMGKREVSGTICVDEGCQVYASSRKNNPGAWKKAVEDTRGMVVVSNSTNDVFSTLYASTSGGSTYSYTSLGHSTPSLWDTKCNNGNCWPGDAWEKQIPSPWFYKGWYKTRSGVSVGRSHPWLNTQEFSDIVNAVLYFTKNGDSSHLSQVQNCLSSCDSNAWSAEELARQVTDKGGPVSKITNVKINFGNNGQVSTVTVDTDKGSFNFPGNAFKEIFSIRAPGALHIKSMLFNIEKK